MVKTQRLMADVHYAPTSDGWALALHRYRMQVAATPAVLLCSGYACNRHFIDFDDRYSLARYLAREGFDAWVVELRGRGMSRPRAGNAWMPGWTFDELAHIDVPTALRFVQGRVGRQAVAWVGHSMGGMVLYAHLGTAPLDAVPAAAVTLSSPVAFPAAASLLVRRLGILLLSLPGPATVPQRAILGALWHLVGRSRALEVGMNPANVDRAVVGTALRRAMSNTSRAKLRQLARWSMDGTFTSSDARIDYRANLRRVQTPLLVITGGRDHLAPPASVAPAYELVATRDKHFVVVDRAHGFSTDYGHVDIVLGRGAPDEVFPLVADWLRDRLPCGGD